jgi:hypothetical protein
MRRSFDWIRAGLAAAWLAAVAVPAHADLVLPRVSPNATVKQTLGVTDLTLTYSRPGVKNRAIWGQLVPFDKPWRTGANEATTFTTTDDITVSGQKLPAGTYSFFTIPAAGDWTVIFSKQKELWGSTDYDPKQDALRVTAKPDTTQPHQEWMMLGFDDLSPASCNLVLRWQRLRLAVPIAVDVNAIALARCRTEVAAAKPDDARTPMRAAQFCFDNTVALDEGKQWLARSLQAQPNYSNLTLQARWLMKDGKKNDAIAAAKKAIDAGKASKDKVDTSGTEKLLADWQAAK